MAEHIDEQISALVDGELSKDECRRLMEELRVDPSAAASWCNYHLISDALKNNLPTSLSSDFASRVSKVLDTEPPLAAPLPRIRRVPAFVKPALGGALAAAVATVAYIGLGWNGESAVTTNTAPQLAALVPAQATYPVSRVRGSQWDVEQPAVASKLNDYLASHGQYSALTGVLPQVRIVGFERSEALPPTVRATERCGAYPVYAPRYEALLAAYLPRAGMKALSRFCSARDGSQGVFVLKVADVRDDSWGKTPA